MHNTIDQHAEDIRIFNRFYTGHIGALNQHLLNSPYNLTECRILFEVSENNNLTAANLSRSLQLDKAHISRILRKFKSLDMLEERPGEKDRREKILHLTTKGVEVYSGLNLASHDEMANVLQKLNEEDQLSLVQSMQHIESLLTGKKAKTPPIIIRQHQPGDIGQIISGHAKLYTSEYGWDETFEGMVAGLAGKFLDAHDNSKERCWVAEQQDRIVGSAFVVDAGNNQSQLRMLFVDKSARGFGIGKQLLSECLRFAKGAGYKSMKLWTIDILLAARRLYEAEGFTLHSENKHHSFGVDLVSQIWERDL